MNKKEFLDRLSKKLSSLSKKEREEQLAFYSEMIDDRIEEGLTETEAVASFATEETVTADMQAEEKPPKGRKAWEIVLLALGSPIWLSLMIAAMAVILSLYVSLWAVVISFWAIFAALVASGVCGVVAGAAYAIGGYVPSGLAVIGIALACVGLAIGFFFLCNGLSAVSAKLTKLPAVYIGRKFGKKERAQ